MSLKISISGVRGIANESLTPQIALDFALAFGSWCNGGKVILGYDPRVSMEVFRSAVVSGLVATGCEVIDIGVVPTPTVQIMVREQGAAGGVIITASHNPIMWNGLKFVRHDGIFLNEAQAGDLISRYEKIAQSGPVRADATSAFISYKPFDCLGRLTMQPDALTLHMNKVLAQVNLTAIRGRQLNVALDTCNGGGSIVLPRLLEALGCKVTVLNGEPTGRFSHNPEPVPSNLTELSQVMKNGNYDVGFAVDADADRLAIINEKGDPIGEDYTLTLLTDYMLAKTSGKGLVVTNLSTTQCIDKIAQRYGADVIRTKIGEVNVSEVLLQKSGTVGGEGNGGVMIPAIGFGRDSLAGVAFICELIASRGKTVSALVGDMPSYIMVKDKVELSGTLDLAAVLANVKTHYSDQHIDDRDGIKVIYTDSWVHIRPSNTEPIIRIIAEDRTAEGAQVLIDQIKKFL